MAIAWIFLGLLIGRGLGRMHAIEEMEILQKNQEADSAVRVRTSEGTDDQRTPRSQRSLEKA